MPSQQAVSTNARLPFDPEWLSHGDYADLYLEDASSLAIRWEEGKVERFTGGQESGAGLRYLIGAENRYGYADNPDRAALEKLFRDLAGSTPVRANGKSA